MFLAPIITAVGGALGLGTLGTAILSLGVGVGLQYLSKKLSGSGKKQETPGGVQSSVQFGGDVARSAIFGRQATAGQLAYVNSYGANNRYHQRVYVIGDGEHDALEAMWVNGKAVSLNATPDAMGIPIPEFGNKMWVRWFSGTLDQAADPQLVANANPAGRWTENHRGAGVAYVSITYDYDAEIFQSGIPEPLFQCRGLKIYDPRYDSTVEGGSGAQRWDDPSTWAWTDLVAPNLHHFRRGVWLNGELILGMGLPAYDLRLDHYIAASNVCDEDVPLKEGGTEKRYRIGMIVDSSQDHRTWIEQFTEAMAGEEIDQGGQFAPIAGVAQIPVMTIYDKDLLSNAPHFYREKLPRTERRNAVFGKYSEPSQMWEQNSYPPRVSSADEAADGGQRFSGDDADYPQVYSNTQAQRLSEITRRAARFQAVETVNLPFKYIVLEPGDWLIRDSNRPLHTKIFKVLRSSLTPQHLISADLREVHDSIYPWDAEDDEKTGQTPVDLPGEGVRQQTVTGLGVNAIEIEGTGGQKRPALRVYWTPTADQTIDAVVGEYRIVGTTDAFPFRENIPPSGQHLVVSGIQAATDYEVRATIETTPRRITEWTDWVPATSTANHVVPRALAADGISSEFFIDPAILEAAFRQTLESFQESIREYREKADLLAHAVADIRRGDELDRNILRQTLRAQANRLRALVSVVDLVYVTPNEARAQRIELVEAALADPDNPGDLLAVASVLSSLEASVTDELAAQAILINALDVEVGDHNVSITQLLSATIDDEGSEAKVVFLADINGRISGMFLTADGIATDISFLADTFQIYNPDSGELALYFDSSASRLVLDTIEVKNAIISGEIRQDGGLKIQSPFVWGARFADPVLLLLPGPLYAPQSSQIVLSPGRGKVTANGTFYVDDQHWDENNLFPPIGYFEVGAAWLIEANRMMRFYEDGHAWLGHNDASGNWVNDTYLGYIVSDAILDPLGKRSTGRTKWWCRSSNIVGVQTITAKNTAGEFISLQWIRVPAGMHRCRAKLWGAAGANGVIPGWAGVGGFIQADFPVTPLEFLRIIVGEGGQTFSGKAIGFGGRSRGHTSSFSGHMRGGGGATMVFRGTVNDANLLLAAGGGGSAFNTTAGGTGGHATDSGGQPDFNGIDADIISGQYHSGGGGGRRGGGILGSGANRPGKGGTNFAHADCTAVTSLAQPYGTTTAPNEADPDYQIFDASRFPGRPSPNSDGTGRSGLAVLEFFAS